MCGVINTWDTYTPETTTTTTVTERVFDEAGNVVKETVTETVVTSRKSYNPYPYRYGQVTATFDGGAIGSALYNSNN